MLEISPIGILFVQQLSKRTMEQAYGEKFIGSTPTSEAYVEKGRPFRKVA